MKNALRKRFWIEIGMAIVSTVMFVVTFVWNDWIEMVFHVDPDSGNGTFEWLVVGALLVVSIALFTLATFEWRRARVAISQTA